MCVWEGGGSSYGGLRAHRIMPYFGELLFRGKSSVGPHGILFPILIHSKHLHTVRLCQREGTKMVGCLLLTCPFLPHLFLIVLDRRATTYRTSTR